MASPGPSRWRCGSRRTSCSRADGRGPGAGPGRRVRRAGHRPARAAGRLVAGRRAGAGHRGGAGRRPAALTGGAGRRPGRRGPPCLLSRPRQTRQDASADGPGSDSRGREASTSAAPARRWPAPGQRLGRAGCVRGVAGRDAAKLARRPSRGSPARRRCARPDDAATRSCSAPTLDRLVGERGWGTEVAVGGVMGRWAQVVGPEVAAHAAPEALRRRRAAGAGRLHGLGHAGAAARADPAAPAGRGARRGPVERDRRCAGPVAPSWRKGMLSGARPGAARHLRLRAFDPRAPVGGVIPRVVERLEPADGPRKAVFLERTACPGGGQPPRPQS